MSDTARFISTTRGAISPSVRPDARVVVDKRKLPTPAVIQEYIAKQSNASNLTPVYAPMPIISAPKVTLQQPTGVFADKPVIKSNAEMLDEVAESVDANLDTAKLAPSTRHSKLLAKTTNKAMLLTRALEAEMATNKFDVSQVTKNPMVRRVAIIAMLVGILGSTGYVSYSTWQTNTEAKEVISTISSSSSSTSVPVVVEDTKTAIPDNALAAGVTTDIPAANALDSYQVAPDMPRAIYINKINVAAKILPMGINADKSLQAPVNAYDAGWYNASAKPGANGAMLVDGHSSQSGTYYGLFARLNDVNVGDSIVIERGDGVKITYIVRDKSIEPLASLDMKKTLVPYGGAQKGLNIIACTGQWTADKSTLDQRLVVYATVQ